MANVYRLFSFKIIIYISLTLTGLLSYASPQTRLLPDGRKVILLNAATEGQMLGADVEIFEDASKKLQFQDILTSEIQQKFQTTDNVGLNLGLNKSYHWIRMDVQNLEPDLKKEWLLEISYPIMDSIEFYYQKADGSWYRKILGDYLPFARREIKHRHFVISLNQHDGDVHKYYIKAYVKGTLEIPLTFKTKMHFLDSNSHKELLYGLFFGALLIMAAFNFFLYLSLSDRSYLYYVLNILSSVVIVASLSGHGLQYLWPKAPILGNHLLVFALFAWNASSAFFAKDFLNNGKLHKTLNNFLGIYRWFALSLISLFLVEDYFITVQVFMFAIILTCVVVMSIGIYSWAHGNRPARYFSIAWGIYLSGNVTRILANIGLLPTVFWTLHGFKFGAAIELVMLTLALGDRYSRIRKEKEQTQYHLLKLQKEANETLERKVEERTREVRNQRRILEESSREVTASIRYAKTIQEAILPEEDKIRSYFKESFILYRPKDIVSGDFYWFAVEEDKIFFAVADCTGHGVPGALMSMLGSQLLNQIVRIHKIHEPAEILLHLHFSLNRTLRQGGKSNSQDGMDISLIVIDKVANKLEFAGANNPLLYLKNGELNIIKGDRLGVGGLANGDIQFTNHEISLSDDMAFYLFTDGLEDQFGGPQGKKFLQRRIKELIEMHGNLSMYEQEYIVSQALDLWMGDEPQLDDILFTGFRLKSSVKNSFKEDLSPIGLNRKD
jgi:serine phosphatase RsbU (regulator of sigma subunit)